MSLSQFLKNGAQLGLTTGPLAVAAGDLLEIGGPGNEATSATSIDYAVHEAAGTIHAAANTDGGNFAVSGNWTRTQIARDPQGNIFAITSRNGASTGLGVSKLQSDGTLIGSPPVTLDNTADQMLSPKMLTLTNGVFAVAYMDASTFGVKHLVFDTQLDLVKSPTVIGTARNTVEGLHAACTLAGGGYAVAYQDAAQHLVLATFDNTGAAVLAPKTIETFGGTAADAVIVMKQDSDGNLAVVWHLENGTATPLGTEFLVVTTAGNIVAGPTNIGGQVGGTYPTPLLNLETAPGFFAVSVVGNASATPVTVISNAGAVVGTASAGGPEQNAYHSDKLLTDGKNFWYLATLTNDIAVTEIDTTAAVVVTATVAVTSGFPAAGSFDAVFANNVIICAGAAGSGTTTPFYAVIGLPDPSLGIGKPYAVVAGTALSGGTTPTQWIAVIGGDFTGIFAWDNAAAGSVYYAIIKTLASAIVGASLTNVAAGNPGTKVVANPGPGDYIINPLIGASGTTFDHSAATPAGNKGTIYSRGAKFSGV